jgi:hypothetical protein
MVQAWRTGDVKAVHGLMAEDSHTINPIFGDKKSSREEWENMVGRGGPSAVVGWSVAYCSYSSWYLALVSCEHLSRT